MAVASDRGETAWAWINDVTKLGQSFGGLYDSADFASLDDKLGIAISSASSGDVAQHIFNLAEEMAKVGLMIKGRQQYFLVLGHFE